MTEDKQGEKPARKYWIAMCSFNDGLIEVYKCSKKEFEYPAPAVVIRVIEHSAYDALAKENEELKANYNGLDLEFDQFRARCPIPNMDVINDNIKLRQEITSLRESLEKLEKEIETAIDSLLFYAQGRDPVIRRLTDNGEGQLSAWQCARALLDKIKAKGGL